jgi:competence protein ComGF
MLKLICYSIIIFCLISCNSYTSANVNQSSKSDNCEEWDKKFESLREVDKDILQNEGIVMGSDGWIIGSKLISDCSFRNQMATYLYRYRLDNDKWAVEFASKNSKSIVDILRMIWSSPSFSSDGNISEKYMLLLAKGLKDEDLIPFVKELVQTEGIQNSDDNQLDYILFVEPDATYRPILYQLLSEAEAKQDLSQQARLLILLQQERNVPELAQKLEKISTNKLLQLESRKILFRIISKKKKGKLSKDDYYEFDNLNISFLNLNN